MKSEVALLELSGIIYVLPFSQACRAAKNCLDYSLSHLCEQFSAAICIRGQFSAQALVDSVHHRGFVVMLCRVAKSSNWIFKHTASPR